MSFKKARKQVVAIVLTLVLAVAQFALPVSAAVYDAVAGGGYIPPVATTFTFLGSDEVTLTTRSGMWSFMMAGSSTGPITYTRNSLPDWIILSPNDATNTVNVSMSSIGVPPYSVSAIWPIQLHRGGFTVNAWVSADLTNELNFVVRTLDLTSRDDIAFAWASGDTSGAVTFHDRVDLPDWVELTWNDTLSNGRIEVSVANAPASEQNFSGTVYAERAGIAGGGRILINVNVDIPEIPITTEQHLIHAVAEAAASGTPTTIEITNDITLGATLVIPNNANITFTGSGTLTSGTGFNRTLHVGNGGELTLDGITVSGGGIRVGNNGLLTMLSGYITNNNTTTDGGGVDVSEGTFIMYGGTISNNQAPANGGGVRVANHGTFIMHDGLIYGNTGSAHGGLGSGGGGGVTVGSWGTFTMHGGRIENNTSNTDGGGVHVGLASSFTMEGGIITGNIPNPVGGEGNFIHNGGIVEDSPSLTTPAAPAPFALTYAEMGPGVMFQVTIPETPGAEYSWDGGTTWGISRSRSAQPGDIVTGYKRIAAVAGVSYASAITYATVTIPAFGTPTLTTPAAPAAFTLTFVETDPDVEFTVTIPETAGAEYSFDGGTTWGATRTTTALPGDIVTGYKRIAAVAGVSYASAATYASVTIPAFGTTQQQAATPTATPNGGTFTTSVSVTLETATAGAEIFFTTDGTVPTSASTLFDAPIVLTATTTIRAIATAANMTDSEVLEITFTRQQEQTGPPSGWPPPTGGGGGSNVIPRPPVDTPPTDTPPTPPVDTPPIDTPPTDTPPHTILPYTLPPSATVNAPAGVNVNVPQEVAELAALGGRPITVNVTTQPTQPTAGVVGVAVGFSVTADDSPHIPITWLPARIAISVPLDNVSTATNHHRIVAVAADGTILGGSFNRASGMFTLETDFAGDFTIAYVQNITRLLVQMDSFLIVDLADNATVQTMDVLPTVVSGRTLLPARFIAQALGGTASWNSATRQSTITIGGASVTMREGELVPGMDVPVQVINGRTMVPARFISETFGAVVRWDSATQSNEIIR